MGTSCSHTNTKKLCETEINAGYLFTSYRIEEKCTDCGETFPYEVTKGNFFGGTYSKTRIYKETCKHQYFTVDEDKKEVKIEDSNIVGLLAAMVTTIRDFSQHRYWKAPAVCDRCLSNFYVRCEFKSVWENMNLVDKRSSPWEKCLKRVVTQKSESDYVLDTY